MALVLCKEMKYGFVEGAVDAIHPPTEAGWELALQK